MKHPFLSLVAALAFLLPLHASAQSSIVAFGDSLSDNGNNGTATSGPTTNPSSQIAGTWVKQLANQLGLPLTASDNGGTNYARGGAVTSGMSAQVNNYLAAHPTASATALYVLWGGGNDINYKAQANPFDSAGIKAAATTAANNINAQVRKLVAAGAKRILWVNMPPLNKTPAALSVPGGLGNTVLAPPVTQFNTLWSSHLTQLRRDFPSVTFIGMNAFNQFNAIIAAPSAYSLTNVTGTAKGKAVNPDKYLFWDEIHPTSYAHRIFADYGYDLVSDAFGFSAGLSADEWTVEAWGAESQSQSL
ncbi:SGNH/GDSL hydrolase family protein [Corallococcus sp. BB11-1]|uniref:SGNH/GDSL hydrolase family protein n=1 Tax=Corallococcus sp. BB11-1 TaxID=2996783 RepID=UPI00226DCEFD|nr:SGNH/GDSL hydrolase family protein [Corallococcus sp. BB11-1]MCY1035400.1 SGNH/GDSL hydrolase family protein [Corallococcus sp. BB11-1]